MNLSRVCYNQNFGNESVTVLRSVGGGYVPGGWSETKTTLELRGIVTAPDGEELDQVPEADRVKGAILFYSPELLHETNNTPKFKGTSDQLQWQGQLYRVARLWPYHTRGFYKVLAVRMSGQ